MDRRRPTPALAVLMTEGGRGTPAVHKRPQRFKDYLSVVFPVRIFFAV